MLILKHMMYPVQSVHFKTISRNFLFTLTFCSFHDATLQSNFFFSAKALLVISILHKSISTFISCGNGTSLKIWNFVCSAKVVNNKKDWRGRNKTKLLMHHNASCNNAHCERYFQGWTRKTLESQCYQINLKGYMKPLMKKASIFSMEIIL